MHCMHPGIGIIGRSIHIWVHIFRGIFFIGMVRRDVYRCADGELYSVYACIHSRCMYMCMYACIACIEASKCLSLSLSV